MGCAAGREAGDVGSADAETLKYASDESLDRFDDAGRDGEGAGGEDGVSDGERSGKKEADGLEKDRLLEVLTEQRKGDEGSDVGDMEADREWDMDHGAEAGSTVFCDDSISLNLKQHFLTIAGSTPQNQVRDIILNVSDSLLSELIFEVLSDASAVMVESKSHIFACSIFQSYPEADASVLIGEELETEVTDTLNRRKSLDTSSKTIDTSVSPAGLPTSSSTVPNPVSFMPNLADFLDRRVLGDFREPVQQSVEVTDLDIAGIKVPSLDCNETAAFSSQALSPESCPSTAHCGGAGAEHCFAESQVDAVLSSGARTLGCTNNWRATLPNPDLLASSLPASKSDVTQGFLPDAATAVLYAADLLESVDSFRLASYEALDVRKDFLHVERKLLKEGGNIGAETEQSQIYHKLIFDLINQELELACWRGSDNIPWTHSELPKEQIPCALARRQYLPILEQQRHMHERNLGFEVGEAVRRHLLARVGEISSIGEGRWLGIADKHQDVMDVEMQLEGELRAMDKEWVSREHYEVEEGQVMLDIVDTLLDDLLVDSLQALAIS